ncbi:hypothetical protein CYY_003735 [Polysphondylium violaceum]|uniref:Uncharacterized protein n=1 Tax=Polysphondylium violaceum TaxID=133409 RepID=A0A8J4PZ87_9MYCE|nr:hypothetical protein CYY_003735 [Polysphondylium violaceum]
MATPATTTPTTAADNSSTTTTPSTPTANNYHSLFLKYITPNTLPFKTGSSEGLLNQCALFARMFVSFSSFSTDPTPLSKKDIKLEKKLLKLTEAPKSKEEKKAAKDASKEEKKKSKDEKKKVKEDKKKVKVEQKTAKDYAKDKDEVRATAESIKTVRGIIDSMDNSISLYAPCMQFVKCPEGPAGLECKVLKESSIAQLKAEACWSSYLNSMLRCQEKGNGKCVTKNLGLARTCKNITGKSNFTFFDLDGY